MNDLRRSLEKSSYCAPAGPATSLCYKCDSYGIRGLMEKTEFGWKHLGRCPEGIDKETMFTRFMEFIEKWL